MIYLSEIFGDMPRMLVHYFQIILNVIYVCHSVCLLTSLLKLDKYRDISSSWRDIFLKFPGDIVRMLAHYFKIILNFMYVCQSVSWLTSLLKLYKYSDISCYRWDIFHIFLGYFPWMFGHYFQINMNCLYVCQSVRWLTSLLKLDKYRDIYISGWDIFLKSFRDIPGMFLH